MTFSFGSLAQNNWGVGLRAGDPSGITVKKYTGNNALEFSIGRSHWWSRGSWYNRRFDDWYRDQNYNYQEFKYVGYKASAPLGMQLHYLFHRDITNIGDESISGLDWYFGFGGQFRMQQIAYDYRYKVQGDPNWYYVRGERFTDIDLGADGVIGLEYTFDQVPISVFLDVTLFMEIVDDPFIFWGQSGLGGRYNF